MFDEIKQIEKRAFLNSFIETGNITEACKIANVGRTTCWLWRKDDKQFNEACKVAEEVYRGNYLNELEQELKKRAMDGTDKMSTVAIFFALKAEAPNKYREKPMIDKAIIGDIVIKMAVPPYRIDGVKLIEGGIDGQEGADEVTGGALQGKAESVTKE